MVAEELGGGGAQLAGDPKPIRALTPSGYTLIVGPYPYTQVHELLVTSGADVEAKNKKGYKPEVPEEGDGVECPLM